MSSTSKPSHSQIKNSLVVDGGEMGERIRAFEWAGTVMGPISDWPQSLRTAVNILLSSRYAMWMGWGPELIFLCNDTYLPTLGIKQPWALGARADLVWAEIWPEIGPRIQSVLTTGVATYDEGLLLFLERSGFPEETYHTFSYSPLNDDSGQIAGMLCVVAEETDRIIGERRIETLHRVAAQLAKSYTEGEVLNALDLELSKNRKDLPFTLTYLFDESGDARLASSSGINPGHELAPYKIPSGSNSPWPVLQAVNSPSVHPLEPTADSNTLPQGEWTKPPEKFVIAPIRSQGQENPAGFLIAAINPFRRFDGSYSGFIDLLVGQIAAALANARAYDSERRRAESLAELDRAKTTFFSNVSHELRTPLTLLLGPTEDLLTKFSSGEERELLELVHRNGLRLQKLVNTLLDFSRLESGRIHANYQPVELGRFTRELASNFTSAMARLGIQFIVACDPLDKTVYVDTAMWEKIVLNLISNALKFTLSGSVCVELKSANEHAELTVKDTGVGIPKAELPHLFERFHRVDSTMGRTMEGTGIGLALVHELVKIHGGSVSVVSELGSGTTFTVRIPFGTEHLQQDRLNQASTSYSTAIDPDAFIEEASRWLHTSEKSELPVKNDAAKVLLVDDNSDMRQYLRGLLAERWAVVSLADGKQALEAALADPPDLILSDIMMPGLNGIELVQALRSHQTTHTIPIILLSARAGEESRFEGLEAGADDYLVKPFTARELIARVSAHLSMRERRKQAEAALQESQATLQSFYDSSPLMMGVVELIGDEILALYSNSAAASFARSTDYSPIQEVAGSALGIPSGSNSLWVNKYLESLHARSPIHFEYEDRASSQVRWLSATVTYLGHGPAGYPRFSFVAEDISGRKHAEFLINRSNQELRRANTDLEQFAFSASHDLQEPLRQVAVFSELLSQNYASVLDATGLRYLSHCVEGGHRMEMLIRDLLAYSQSTSGSSAPDDSVNLNEVLEDVKANLATSIKQSGATILNAELPTVMGDPVPFHHLFQNLISNALKYRTDQAPEIKISATRQDGFWLFQVQDNGIGIEEKYHKQIFGIFKRLHDKLSYPGTGIGLAICQKVVERYGGEIWVESSEGQGATFFFTLPFSNATR